MRPMDVVTMKLLPIQRQCAKHHSNWPQACGKGERSSDGNLGKEGLLWQSRQRSHASASPWLCFQVAPQHTKEGRNDTCASD